MARGLEEWLARLVRPARNKVVAASRRVAVLIDGDSFSPRLCDQLFRYATSFGQVASAQLFANFAASSGGEWSSAIRTHGIKAMQHFNGNNGKNGADIALVIAALELLDNKRAEVFVIVTADSDFTALAHRIKQCGAAVHGVGPDTASVAFRKSCSVFVNLDNLENGAIASSGEVEPVPRRWSLQPADAEAQILEVLVSVGGAVAWVSVSDLAESLTATSPTFHSRTYRRRNLLNLLSALDSVTVDRRSKPARVRLALTRNGLLPEQEAKS